MKDTAKKTLATAKNFVVNHKTAIAVVATATVTVVAMRKIQGAALKEAYEFIEAKDLLDDFLNSTHVFES